MLVKKKGGLGVHSAGLEEITDVLSVGLEAILGVHSVGLEEVLLFSSWFFKTIWFPPGCPKRITSCYSNYVLCTAVDSTPYVLILCSET